MKQLTPISRERANDAVYSAMRQAVLTSVLKPGQKLNVSELATQLGVSLTPVRNAIQLLAAEGLIEVHPRSGTFVATVNANDVRETFEIRRALECLAVELATIHITGKELDQLRALLAAMKKPVRSEDELLQHQQDNARFHMTILESARNARLLDAYQRLNAHIQIARVHAAEPDWKSRIKDERNEHEDIVDAIASGDGARGASAMRAHVDRACASLIQSIERKKKLKRLQPQRIARIEALPISIERDLGKATGTAGSPSKLLAGAGKYKWSSTVAAVYSERIETTLVRITTDDGSTGWGEAQAPVAPRVSAAIVEDILASVLVGETLEGTRQSIERLWNLMFRTMRVRGQNSGFMMDAISGVDIALWDLAGQMAGLPVAQLIAGGKARASVPAYLSGLSGATIEDRCTFAREHFDKGFRHNKVFFDSSEESLLDTLDTLQEALGSEARLAVDALWRLSWPESRGFIEQLAQRGILWLEAPFLPDEAEPHDELFRAMPQLPVALGESYRTRREMNWFLNKVSYLQPDLGRSGITESLRLAEAGVPVVPHVSIALGPQIAAAIHLTAALDAQRAPLCEYNPQVFEASNRFLREPLRMIGREYEVPQTPGLGVSLELPTVVLM